MLNLFSFSVAGQEVVLFLAFGLSGVGSSASRPPDLWLKGEIYHSLPPFFHSQGHLSSGVARTSLSASPQAFLVSAPATSLGDAHLCLRSFPYGPSGLACQLVKGSHRLMGGSSCCLLNPPRPFPPPAKQMKFVVPFSPRLATRIRRGLAGFFSSERVTVTPFS